MMRCASLFLLASPVVSQGISAIDQGKGNGNGNSAFGQAQGNNFFLRNDGANGSLNTRRDEETITRKDTRLTGEVPEGLMTPMYDPVLDAVCFTDPAYSPVVSNSKALYDDFVKIFDFGFEVS
jgi:hypothetical protein